MALILAVNPGGTQSAILARVAREIPAHELIGADSCAVELTAIAQRVPALVLLPPNPPKGEPDLLKRLLDIGGGVPTLKLPPPTAFDPRALADRIREPLGEPPAPPPVPKTAPPRTSPHIIAAPNAAIAWIRARRASWPAVPVSEPEQQPEPA